MEQVRVVVARCKVGVADDGRAVAQHTVAGGGATAAGVRGRLAGPQACTHVGACAYECMRVPMCVRVRGKWTACAR